ncbi:MAG: hypothetical protein Q8W46_01615 [Candidatus Palauibacterales bacterium]|jgi:hypothetical protein|nr:hypothetical protein [Candidatus Palauibacterales bacterium]
MRGNRLSFLIVGAAIALGACGGSEVTVQVLGEGADGPVPEANLEVYFYPFDRDSVFDALDSEASSPKPEIPEDMLATFNEISSLQEQWRQKESQWSEARDRMQTLSNEMQGMDPRARGTREYMSKYEEFQQLEGTEGRLNREKQTLFDRFTAMQDSVTARVDSFKAVRDTWEDENYADYFDIEETMVEELGRQVYTDTTNAEGYVTQSLPSGNWWVQTRLRTDVTHERVWSLLIDPTQVDTLRLETSNGQERIRL